MTIYREIGCLGGVRYIGSLDGLFERVCFTFWFRWAVDCWTWCYWIAMVEGGDAPWNNLLSERVAAVTWALVDRSWKAGRIWWRVPQTQKRIVDVFRISWLWRIFSWLWTIFWLAGFRFHIFEATKEFACIFVEILEVLMTGRQSWCSSNDIVLRFFWKL